MDFVIYLLDAKALCDETFFQKFYEKMPLHRKEKIKKMKAPLKRVESLAAGIVSEFALENAGISGKQRIPEILKGGKPVYKGFSMNLSHSDLRIMCAIAPVNVGCDVERTGRKGTKDIARRFFSEAEKEYAEVSDENFLRIWTLKESYVKLLGQGLSKTFDSFSFENLGEKEILCVRDEGLINKDISFLEIDFGDGFRQSVAYEKTDKTPVIKWLEIKEDGVCIR